MQTASTASAADPQVGGGFQRSQDLDVSRGVALACQKGGTGKTTGVVSIAAEASRLGARVLMIDADPNAGLTRSHLQLEIEPGDPDAPMTLTDVLADGRKGIAMEALRLAPAEWQPRNDLDWHLGGALIKRAQPPLVVLPGARNLPAAIQQIASQPAFDRRLQRVLSGVARQFDLVLVDTGPQNDITAWLTRRAVGTTIVSVMPTKSDILGMESEAELLAQYDGAWDDFANRFGGTILTGFMPQWKQVHAGELARARDLGRALTDQSPVTAGQEMPPPPGIGAQTWTAGPMVWPEIVPQTSYYATQSNNGLPVWAGLIPPDDAPSYVKLGIRKKATPQVLRWTRIALRVLQLVDAPCLPEIAAALEENDIRGLWDDDVITVLNTDEQESEE